MIDDLLAAARAGLRRLDPTEAAAAAGNGARLVDTRPQSQRQADGEIPGALVIERNQLEWRLDPTSAGRIPEATHHDIAWIVLCDEGYSSSLAAASLQRLRLRNATDVIGGFQAWKRAGLPITTPATPAVLRPKTNAAYAGGADVSVANVATAYDRHTGRYGSELSAAFARFAGLEPWMRVLDVGCGPGALTVRLAELVGAERVAAVDPSEAYADACRARAPGADVRVGCAEALPFGDGAFDAVLAQLVVQALDDAPSAVRELRRVASVGGMVAACVWDFRGGMPLLDAYWAAAMAVDPDGARAAARDVSNPWCTRDGLRRLWAEAGIEQLETTELSASGQYESFEDAWFSFSAGVSASGAYCRSLDERRQEALREEFRCRLGAPAGPFRLEARAWAVRGLAGRLPGA